MKKFFKCAFSVRIDGYNKNKQMFKICSENAVRREQNGGEGGRGGNVKSKKILRFYFSAEKLNGALDNMILSCALGAYGDLGACEIRAERMVALIDAKARLSELWGWLDGALALFPETDRAVLERYAKMRGGVTRLGEAERRDIHRVVVRFTRRVEGRLGRFSDGIRLVNRYYAFL